MNFEKEGFALFETQKRTESENNTILFENPIKIYQFSTFDFPGWQFFDDLRKEGFVVAALAYELNAQNEDIQIKTPKLLPFPDAFIAVYENYKMLDQPPILTKQKSFSLKPIEQDISKTAYLTEIKKIKEHIYNGDIFQINFTSRSRYYFSGDVPSLYSAFKNLQPVPYSAFINIGSGKYIISGSPELFFRIKDKEIITKPMKGTIENTAETNAAKLFKSAKDRAENIMIADLMRNDLGKICRFGSVKARKIFNIEKYSTVFQMTSSIHGTLNDGTSISDIFKALFPAGSITGAPKKRAMQIIYEHENSARQLYTGTIGFILPDFVEFNVAIRTILLDLKKNLIEYGSGGGIVYDSDSTKEYNELQLKIKALDDLCKI